MVDCPISDHADHVRDGELRSSSPRRSRRKMRLEIFVTGKQWMWKIQYGNGGREIDELHVAVGQPVKLTMASEDVIHSFSIPAFRIKHDVVPGHYDSYLVYADQTGTLSLVLYRILRLRNMRT